MYKCQMSWLPVSLAQRLSLLLTPMLRPVLGMPWPPSLDSLALFPDAPVRFPPAFLWFLVEKPWVPPLAFWTFSFLRYCQCEQVPALPRLTSCMDPSPLPCTPLPDSLCKFSFASLHHCAILSCSPWLPFWGWRVLVSFPAPSCLAQCLGSINVWRLQSEPTRWADTAPSRPGRPDGKC